MPIDFRASQIQTNKLIASGSTGTEAGAQLVVYPHSADDGTAPNQGFIDQSVFVTSSIGTDIFLYVSGGIGQRNVGGAKSISVFGGDLHVSGNLTVDGTYPAGGGGGGSGTSFYRLEVLDYYATNNTSTTTAGQVIFPANQFTGSIVLYGVIANSDATATGSVRLYNVSSGSYVEIGGIGNQHLSVTGITPTIVTSVNLISASNFNSSSQAIYELQVSSSNGASTAFFGGFELRPSGSFTGNTYISASNVYYYVSGTWEDGGNKLATTASVAITGLQGPGFFADNVGSDVFFYVSGNNGGVAAGNGVSVFGGDVVISGVLHGGSPLKIGTSILQDPNNNSIDAGNYNVILATGTNSYITGVNSENNAIIGASTIAIEGETNYANRNTILSSDTVSITTNGNDANFNSINASNGVYIDGSGGSSINSGFFVLVESASYNNSINSSLAIIATSASLVNGTLAAGDAANLFSPTISVIENSWGSAIIAGGPNFISSSDGNPIINSAIVGSNWVITSSRTYAIGDTVNPATVLISASNGVSITGDTNVVGNFTVNGSPVGGGGLAAGKQHIASATTTTTTTALMIGQFSWVPSDYTGLTSVKVRAIMSTDGTANHTGSLQIYNLTSGSYVDLIDAPSTSIYFDITSSIPTLVTSSNLLTGITNFDNSSISVYEVRVSGSTANNTIIGGVELIFS